MSTSERETHFQGFAKLVVRELFGDASSINVYTWDEQGIARLEQVIARRAYDLACHVLYETSYGLDRFYIPERINESVPDLPTLPQIN